METIEYVVRDHVARVTLNRPEKLNAINLQMRLDLRDAFTDIQKNPEVWLAILTGRGKAFCAGHDLEEPVSVGAGPTSVELFSLQLQIYKPIIAAINGVCLAQGGGLALLSDIRIASKNAKFGWPQAKWGITSVSGPTMLARRIPVNRAFELLFTGDFLTADEAHELGLVNYVTEPEEVMERGEAIAQRILANAPLAVSAMKEIVARTEGMSNEQAFKFAFLMFEKLEQTEDAKEGLRAFQEKRRPTWRGR